jgi:carboxylate-amine ligase
MRALSTAATVHSARWNATAAPWSVELEEDVLVVDPAGWAPAPIPAGALAARATPGAGPSALRHATALHARAAEASAELARARAGLQAELWSHRLAAVVAGTHPFATAADSALGLRIRVAVPDPEDGVRALDGLRRHLPALMALAGNSPFRRGRDTGFASSRVALLPARPRTGIPPAFGSYGAYVEVAAGRSALAHGPARWDAWLEPATGTLEVGVLDAQSRVADAAALAALVQCLVRIHAYPLCPTAPPGSTRMLDDNRLRAARDGTDAMLTVDSTGIQRPIRLELEHLVDACLALANELACVNELIGATRLITAPGAQRQRRILSGRHGGRRPARLRALVATLHHEFAGIDEARPRRRIAA